MPADLQLVINHIEPTQTVSQTQIGLPSIEDGSGTNRRKVESVKHFQRLIITINDVFEAAKVSDWDGEGAEAISQTTYFNAIKLLTVLDAELPIPDIFPDNDGYIEFEWGKDRKNFSLYVTDSNLILYAGFYSKNNRLSGRFNFRDNFPKHLIPLINSIYE